MAKKRVAAGSVRINERNFHYEFWSDNSDVTVKIFHHSKDGKATEFQRHDKISLKNEMRDALLNDGVI